jgi:hypothetical protein
MDASNLHHQSTTDMIKPPFLAMKPAKFLDLAKHYEL